MHVQYNKGGAPKPILENIIREIHENGQSAKILALKNYPSAVYGIICHQLLFRAQKNSCR